MSDINALLKEVAPDPEPPSSGVVDSDLARGRAALVVARRRGRIRRAAGSAASLVAVAAVVVFVAHPLGGHGASSGGGHHAGIRLVDYTGVQLAGFTVDEVPAGWHLSTSTPFALLITPDGSANNDPNDFEGKLAVLTSSTDQHGLGGGDPVTVNGRPGRVHVSGGVLILSYNVPDGFGVDIQAPTALGWSDAQIVAFAQGVHVTANAVHSHG